MAKVEGLEKLRAQIRSIPEKVAGQMSEGIGAAAYDLADAIQAHTPRATGALANSVDYCAGDPPADAKMGAADKTVENPLAEALTDKGLRYSVYAGDDRAFYARWVEFGTRAGKVGDKTSDKSHRSRTVKRTHPGTKAQPFFYPTIRARMSRTKSAVSRAVSKALKDAAKSG